MFNVQFILSDKKNEKLNMFVLPYPKINVIIWIIIIRYLLIPSIFHNDRGLRITSNSILPLCIYILHNQNHPIEHSSEYRVQKFVEFGTSELMDDLLQDQQMFLDHRR